MGEDDEMLMTRSLDVTPKNSAFNCKFLRSDKSRHLYVINNKTTLRFLLLKRTTDGYEASSGLFATAELLVNDFEPQTPISRSGHSTLNISEMAKDTAI